MSWKPLGVIQPTPGTPQKITVNFTNLETQHQQANTIYLQVLPGNTGDVYIGGADLDKATPSTVLAVLRPPTSNSLPDISISIASAPNPFVLSDYRIDVDQADDGVRASYLLW
jgi:hypothetical protein